jgi:nucleoside-diphosphate-sugar epimerase
MKKKVTIIGGAGTIGSILYKGLSDNYKIVILDKKKPKQADEFVEVDATNAEMLLERIPKDTDVLINCLPFTCCTQL